MYKVDSRPFVYPSGSRMLSSSAAFWSNRERSSLMFYSAKPMGGFTQYLDHFRNMRFATDCKKLYVKWGIYNKTRHGKSERYDSLNLRHNGWVEGIIKKIPGPDFTGSSVVEKILTMGLIVDRYFLWITPSESDKGMHSQKVCKTLFTLLQTDGIKKKSFTLGEVSQKLKSNELYNTLLFGDSYLRQIVLTEMKIKENDTIQTLTKLHKKIKSLGKKKVKV